MRRFCAVILASLTTACGTVNHGPMQRIHVSSDPAGARVTLRECGVASTKAVETPSVVWVSRRATNCTLHFSAEGYLEETFHLERIVSDATQQNVEAATELCDDLSNCNSLTDLFVVGAV